jgi:hypothetical protein
MPAEGQVLRPHDAFRGDPIDPARWDATPTCMSNGYDCAREVRQRSLRLVCGAFFNAGPPNDDVRAHLIVERWIEDDLRPSSLRLSAFVSGETGAFNFADLGTLEAGEWATATLQWDRADKIFVVRVVKTLTEPHVEERIMSYGLRDHAPPAARSKSLQVITFAPSCATGAPGLGAMDARTDAVRANP